MDAYGKIAKPFWDDRPVAIVGGGPSLVGFDLQRLRGAHVLAVKSSIFDMPWADAGFGLDMPRYREWRDKLADVQCRVYWAVPEDQLERTGSPPSKNVTFLKRCDGQQLSVDPSEVSGGTSGFGAFQIALHKRSREIVLFGFDYEGGSEPAKVVPGHQKRVEQNATNWRNWARHFDVFVPYLTARGISVINACPHSAIGCFQKMSLDDGVTMLHKAA